MSLKTPDACQQDIVNDLLLLKTQCREKNDLRHQDTGYTHKKIGTPGPPYQLTSVEEGFDTISFQSITSMEAYQKQSFEVKESRG